MQTALVTGASRGVGREVAIGLAECGFRVLATGRTVANADLTSAIVPVPFWEQPAHHWTSMMDAGVHAASDVDGRQPAPLTLETV